MASGRAGVRDVAAGVGAVSLASLLGVVGTPAFLAVPLLLGAAMVVWALMRSPLLPVSALIVFFPFIASYTAGLQAGEALYGLYMMGYLGLWFCLRFFVYEERVLHTPADGALFIFLVLATLSGIVPRVLGGPGTVGSAFGDWNSLILIAAYFPVREVVQRYENGLRVVVAATLVMSGVLLLRNVLQFRELTLQATQVWQVARGRVSANEVFMLIPALGCLVLALTSAVPKRRLLWGAGGVLFLGGLILTQSRGYWVNYGLGVFVLALLIPLREKVRLVSYGGLVGAGLFVIGTLLLGPAFQLLIAGVLERVLSIFTSTEQDISLINRFYETSAVVEAARLSPVLGWGIGAEYAANDLIGGGVYTRTFVHNGYAALWYKTGLWGVALVGVFWASTVWHGLRLYRRWGNRPAGRAGLVAVVGFICFLPAVSTSSPFFREDQMFILGILGGIAAGLVALDRTRDAAAEVQHS